jgi:hypothetical protein
LQYGKHFLVKCYPNSIKQQTTTGEKDDGTQWTSLQAKITPRGIAKLAMMLGVDISKK